MNNFFEDALVNPANYIVQTFNRETEDYDGNVEYRTVAYVYKKGLMGINDFELVDNPSDVENLIDLFREKNPEGIE